MSQNEDEIAIKEFFSTSLFQQNLDIESEIWDAGFDVNRQLIFSKLGFYEKVFLRPDSYVKRFFHTCYPLLIENWEIIEQLELYDGFCIMAIKLEVRFQATLAYVEKNIDFLIEINQQIKAAYEEQLLSVVHTELSAISDGLWLKNGLGSIEKKIAALISETLILHHIQAQALCSLKPNFREFPHLQLTKENIHLSLVKKDFEIENKNEQESYRQEIEAENNKIQHKKELLNQLDRDLNIDRRKLVLEAEHKRLILVEQEGMQVEYFAVAERLCAEKIAHENRLKEIHLDADFNQQHILREAEQKDQIESLSHQQKLSEHKLQTDTIRYEQQQTHWMQAKERIYAKKLAVIKKRKEQGQ